MIRILAIGTEAKIVGERLGHFDVEVEVVELPAAGVRAMESTPPDLVIIYSTQFLPTIGLLVDGIQSRPLGQLTPIFVLAPKDMEDNFEKKIRCWESPEISSENLRLLIAQTLGVQIGAKSTPLIQTSSHQGYRIEEISDTRGGSIEIEEELGAEEIRRMLRKVRHEDYFTILGVRRSVGNEQVQVAYSKLSYRFDPTKVEFDLRRSFQEELAEIVDALEDAWAVLGDHVLRETYIESTTRV